MTESKADGVQFGSAVLDIGGDIGALLIHTPEAMLGQEIEISPKGDSHRVHTDVLERWVQNHSVFAALFPTLSAGDYDIWGDGDKPVGEVTVIGGQVVELDWR